MLIIIGLKKKKITATLSKTFATHSILRREKAVYTKTTVQISIKAIQTKALKIHNLVFGNTDTAIPPWQRLNTTEKAFTMLFPNTMLYHNS